MPEAGYDFVPSSGDSHCEKGGPSKAAGEATLIRYLRDAFDHGNRVAVWHIADHDGQIVEYLRMNGIVPPATKQYPLAVR